VARQLLLIGGGHAHLEVLHQLAARPLRDARVTLVSMSAYHHYSSIVPGYLQGRRDEAEMTFDLRAICDAAGVTFVKGCAESIDHIRRRVMVVSDARCEIGYDELSIDAGSIPSGMSTPGVRENAATVRPMSKAVALSHRLDALITRAVERRAMERGENGASALPVCVVGAGAGGVEVTLAIARRLRDAGLAGPITLLDQGDALLKEYPHSAQRRIARMFERRDIRLLLSRTVSYVDQNAVHLDDGTLCEAALTVWLTGAAAPPLLAESALATDDGGFLLVDPTLRSVMDPHVWGAGDCVALRAHPHVAKAGVYAVREGPVLAHNLRVAMGGGRLRSYVPQREFLAILDTADGRGLLRWRGLSWHSRATLALKYVIDRRFMRRYQRLGERGGELFTSGDRSE
jgi:selenide,water dikinase